MHFIDNAKQRWDVAITVGTIRRVKQLAGVDLTRLDGPVSQSDSTPLLTALGVDIELLVSVLYAVVAPQAEALEVSPEAFAERLDGQAVDAGIRALWEAIADFTQPRRPDLATGIRKQAQLIDQEASSAKRKIDAIKSTSGNTASSSQASPASKRKTKRSAS